MSTVSAIEKEAKHRFMFPRQKVASLDVIDLFAQYGIPNVFETVNTSESTILGNISKGDLDADFDNMSLGPPIQASIVASSLHISAMQEVGWIYGTAVPAEEQEGNFTIDDVPIESPVVERLEQEILAVYAQCQSGISIPSEPCLDLETNPINKAPALTGVPKAQFQILLASFAENGVVKPTVRGNRPPALDCISFGESLMGYYDVSPEVAHPIMALYLFDFKKRPRLGSEILVEQHIGVLLYKIMTAINITNNRRQGLSNRETQCGNSTAVFPAILMAAFSTPRPDVHTYAEFPFGRLPIFAAECKLEPQKISQSPVQADFRAQMGAAIHPSLLLLLIGRLHTSEMQPPITNDIMDKFDFIYTIHYNKDELLVYANFPCIRSRVHEPARWSFACVQVYTFKYEGMSAWDSMRLLIVLMVVQRQSKHIHKTLVALYNHVAFPEVVKNLLNGWKALQYVWDKELTDLKNTKGNSWVKAEFSIPMNE